MYKNSAEGRVQPRPPPEKWIGRVVQRSGNVPLLACPSDCSKPQACRDHAAQADAHRQVIRLAFVSEDWATLHAEWSGIEVCCKCSSSCKYRFCEPRWGLMAVPMPVVSSQSSSRFLSLRHAREVASALTKSRRLRKLRTAESIDC